MTEELISLTRFGRLCDPPITRQAVAKAISSGRLRAVDGKLRPSDVAPFSANRHAANNNNFTENGEPGETLSREYLRAKTENEEAKAEKARLEAAALSGELLYREDVEVLQHRMIMAARAKLLSLPTRIAAEIGPKFGIPEGEIQAVAKRQINEALLELSGHEQEAYARYARSKGRKIADPEDVREAKRKKTGRDGRRRKSG